MRRKFIDENGRLFGVISFIDVLVIILVLVISTAVYVKYSVLDHTSTAIATETVEIDIVIKGVRDTNAKILHIGDSLYESGGTCVGRIVDIKVEDAKEQTNLLDGTHAIVSIEDRYDITLTVESECQVTDGRYYVNRTYEVNVNSKRELYTKYSSFSGTIIGIG